MLWPATLLGAAAGLALASIPGALLGTLLGQVLDRRMGLQSWASLRERLGAAPMPSDEELLFVLLGRLAKSGGQVLEAHIQLARAEMRRLQLDDAGQRRAIDAFSRGKAGREGLRLPLRQLRNREGRVEELLRACWRMAGADGRVTARERELILLWGQWLGWRSDRVAALAGEYEPHKGSLLQGAAAYQNALRLLDVTAESEPAAIKWAYRRLLSRHHPDKLLGAGADPARVREATEKTRELHGAYGLIRERRGFR
ncbi:TerB family tellurite resistance protein [Pseudomonas sp. 2FG]|uniref:TerB family tellurite resistance protein n=1 Tax=Pseudomonas sp. 2FG TaxID=2502191 RepID=UPI0010F8DDC3|nr:TerB family tellurite resistance protein [Pseudomonas sp. 2FG]